MADGDAAPPESISWGNLHSFTVDDYHRMAAVGILSADHRVELIEGVIVLMSPIGAPHFATTLRLDRLLRAAVGGRATVSVQGPIKMAPNSETEPDISVLRARPDDYEDGLPGPADVLLLVEVADTSLVKDRDIKAPLYAGHGIVEYWLVDVAAREAWVHRDPVAMERRYRSVSRVGADATLNLAMLPDARIALSAVFRMPSSV